jgi:hypothetical protein
MRLAILGGLLATAVLLTATQEGHSQSRGDVTATAKANETGFDVKASSKVMGETATRLKENAAEKSKKLQELEADLKKNQLSVTAVQKDMGEIVLVLRAAEEEIAPDADYRATLAKEVNGLRSSASQSEVDLDRAIRQKAPYLQQKVAELQALGRDGEEIRTRLVTQIDLLEELEGHMQLPGATTRTGESVRNARAHVEGIEALAGRAERLATELYNYDGSNVAGSNPGPATPMASPPAAASSAPPRPAAPRAVPRRTTTTVTPTPSTQPQ